MDSKFKPMLAPNDEPGRIVDWEQRLGNLTDWIFSEKYNGIRLELDMTTSRGLSRVLKLIRSIEVQNLVFNVTALYHDMGIDVLEGEMYAPGLSLEEIKHFVMSEDVTTPKARKKYANEIAKGKWNGRSLDWLCTYPTNLKLYVFDYWTNGSTKTKLERYHYLKYVLNHRIHNDLVLVMQYQTSKFGTLKGYYDNVVAKGGEGVMLFKKDAPYKTNRWTEKQCQAFKMKDNSNEYEGTIIDVEEGTVVDRFAPKTINELGRSVTSKKKGDRILSGIAKGFTVRMDDGKTLIVSLKNCNNLQKAILLELADDFLGVRINFFAMKPSKADGVPSQAFFDFSEFDFDYWKL